MNRNDSGLGTRRRRAATSAAVAAPSRTADFDAQIAAATVDEITTGLEFGDLVLAEVLASERRGRQRKGILALDPNA